MLSRLFSLSHRVLRPSVRLLSSRIPFGEDPKQEEAKQMLDEVKDSQKEKDEKGHPWLFFATSAVLVVGMYYLQFMLKSPPQQTTTTVKVYGTAKIGGPWTLTNDKGEMESDTDYRGRYIVYYFGFTNCPDICPISLQKLASAMEILKKHGRTDIAFLFVSLDPERDTPAIVAKYTRLFHPELHGLIVPAHSIPEFLKNYKLYSNKVPTGDGGYNLDHTSYMYLMDKEGKFVNVLGANLSNEELAEKVLEHLKMLETPS